MILFLNFYYLFTIKSLIEFSLESLVYILENFHIIEWHFNFLRIIYSENVRKAGDNFNRIKANHSSRVEQSTYVTNPVKDNTCNSLSLV